MSKEDLEEEEILNDLEALSPLAALDPYEVDELPPKQQQFLIAFIHSGNLSQARKVASVGSNTWALWKKDERLQRMLDIIRNPVVFANKLGQLIIFTAAKEH